MKTQIAVAFVLVTLLCPTGVRGADTHDTPHATAHAIKANQPTLPPPQTRWSGAMVIIIVGMFLAAAAIGWMHDLNAPPQEESDAHGHDDAHAGAHDSHGHSDHH